MIDIHYIRVIKYYKSFEAGFLDGLEEIYFNTKEFISTDINSNRIVCSVCLNNYKKVNDSMFINYMKRGRYLNDYC